MKSIALDFEYKKTNEANYTLVCVATMDNEGNSDRFWLYNNYNEQVRCKELLYTAKELICFNADAEGRSLISLGIDPLHFNWFDVQVEYKMIVNHWDKFTYGKQLIDGKVVTTERKNYWGVTRRGKRHDNPQKSLVACTYKLLGEVEDLEYKKEMIQLIINTEEYTEEEKQKILDYCSSDIKNLFRLKDKILKIYDTKSYTKLNKKRWEEIYWRGESVVRSAIMANTGYPVDREKLDMFICRIPDMIKDCQEDINSQFEDKPFVWKKSDNRYAQNLKVQKDWIAQSEYADKWELTPKKAYSLKEDAWSKFFSFRHNFPTGNFPAQMMRYKNLIKSLNGMRPKAKTAKDKRIFKDFYGRDDRAHPYLNSYGAQSARYQPHALGFIHLKAAWMRSLVEPKEGKMIVGIDYKSQEFFLAGIMSGDKNMIESYLSGDVYFHFAKLAKAVPMDALRKDHEKTRNKFKSTVLGLSYGMMAPSLARKLTMDTGIFHTEEEAEKLILLFDRTYKEYARYRERLSENYYSDKYIKLADGWIMFGDNDNERSVRNVPIQGMGSCILRIAIKKCQDKRITPILPLHDALYIETEINNWEAVEIFKECMTEAFAYYFTNRDRVTALKVGLDVNAWGKGIENKSGIETQEIYIDGRSKADYERFSKYFDKETFYECL